MSCERYYLPDGTAAIVCGRGRSPAFKKCRCGAEAPYLCDWKIQEQGDLLGPPKVKTCDAPLCIACAREVGPDKHLCPFHAEMYRRWQVERERRAANEGVRENEHV